MALRASGRSWITVQTDPFFSMRTVMVDFLLLALRLIAALSFRSVGRMAGEPSAVEAVSVPMSGPATWQRCESH
jgi:hypothetical protein